MALLTSFKQIALGDDLKQARFDRINSNGLPMLNSVSFSLGEVSLLFPVAFYFNEPVSLTWFSFVKPSRFC